MQTKTKAFKPFRPYLNPSKIYKQCLPWHGYGSDDLTYGVRVYAVAELIKKAFAQHNAKHSLKWLVYDIDRTTAAYDWDDLQCPAPNIVAVNRDNGHAHLYYGLDDPVHNYNGSSEKALRFIGSIDVALTDKLRADPGYTKLISKNPLHNRWITILQRTELYDLEELADWVDLAKYQDKRRRLPAVGYGRNCTLFERLRHWTYAERRRGPYFNLEMFRAAVLHHGLILNAEYTYPLSHAEVRAIAKSAATWTWKNHSEEGFRLWGDKRRKRSIKRRQQKAEELRQRIRRTKQQCPSLTQTELATLCGCAQDTVYRALWSNWRLPICNIR